MTMMGVANVAGRTLGRACGGVKRYSVSVGMYEKVVTTGFLG